MAFNWMVAEVAHPDWLGAWAPLVRGRDSASRRLLHRASMALVRQHGLVDRYLKRAGHFEWLLLPGPRLEPIARALGVAMLGGWVRNGLEREQVARQSRVLSDAQRAAAMEHAAVLKSLPYPAARSGWPLSRLDPAAVVELGLSCLAGLLADPAHGSRDRFLMRFAKGSLASVSLSDAQREEADRLVQETMRIDSAAVMVPMPVPQDEPPARVEGARP